MARNQIASDGFDSSIGGNWANGHADWFPMVWRSGGYVRATYWEESAAFYTAASFPRAQYSKSNINNGGGWINGVMELGTAVLASAAANDESCYVAGIRLYSIFSGIHWYIWEIDSSFGFTTLGETGEGQLPVDSDLDNGDYVVFESDNSGNLTLFTKEQWDSANETQRLTVNDTTLTSGYPGIHGWSNDLDFVDSWEGGSVGDPEGAGASSGTGSATATGRAISTAVGSSSGTSSVSATGRATSLGAGSTSGTVTVSGVGDVSTPVEGAGSAAGTCSVSGDARYLQIARPEADVSNTGWLNEADGSTLYPSVADESDATYIYALTSGDVCRLLFSDLSDPSSDLWHAIPMRIRRPFGYGSLIARLLDQGVTQIATRTYENVGTDWEDVTFDLTSGEADSLTDYGAAVIELEIG